MKRFHIRSEHSESGLPQPPRGGSLEKIKTDFHLIEISQYSVNGTQLILDGDLQISESYQAYNLALVSPPIGLGDLRRVAILGEDDRGVLNEVPQTAE